MSPPQEDYGGLYRVPPARGRLLNMTTGPVEISPAVAEAQLAPLFTPHTPDFWTLHDETVALLGRVLKTRHLVLPFHGSIRTGLDVALANVVRPGAKVLAVENGYWGRLIGKWAESYGANLVWVRGSPLAPVDADAVAAALKAHPDIELVAIVHVETSTGVVNPVDAIGRAVRAHGALFFVDSACSAGAMDFDTDGWFVDVGVTGSHKCLASVPGLAVVSLSDRAVARLEDGGRPVRSNYFDLRAWIATTLLRREVPPFTQPVGLILALRASLREILARGEARAGQHREAATRFMAGVREAGLQMVLDTGPARNDRDAYSDTVMAVEYPRGADDARFRGAMLQTHGIAVIGNIGEFAGRSFRVGLMSMPQLEPVHFDHTLHAIRALARRGQELRPP